MKVINGDPLTYESKAHRVKIEWMDRVFFDQMTAYEDYVEHNQHANEDLGWTEYLEQIVEEETGVDLSVRWFVYRGKACKNKDEAKVPMVICFDEYYETSWMRVADREGFVVLTFEYHRNIRVEEDALGKPEFGVRPDEIRSYKIVVDRVMQEQNINPLRVYCNGLSYGDMATIFFAKEHGDMLAGIANINGPTSRYNIERFGLDQLPYKLPVLQIRGEDDMSCDGYPAGLALDIKGNIEWQRNMRSRTTIINRDLWMEKNDATNVQPKICSRGNRFFLKYDTESFPVIYNEVADNSHLVPVDYAEVIWEFIFNRFQRNPAGEIEEIGTTPWPEDEVSCGMAVGMDKAYIGHHVVELGNPCIMMEPFEELNEFSEFYCKPQVNYPSFYAPISLLEKLFGITYEIEDVPNRTNWLAGKPIKEVTLDDKIIRFEFRGKRYVLFTNSSLALIDDHAKSLHRPLLYINNVLMIPVAEISKVLGYFSSERNDAIYITDHESQMGFTFARLLREEILAGLKTVKKSRHTVEVLETEGGSVSVSDAEVYEGQQITMICKPKEGYRFKEIEATVNGLPVPTYVENETHCLYNILGNVTIKGVFEKA